MCTANLSLEPIPTACSHPLSLLFYLPFEAFSLQLLPPLIFILPIKPPQILPILHLVLIPTTPSRLLTPAISVDSHSFIPDLPRMSVLHVRSSPLRRDRTRGITGKSRIRDQARSRASCLVTLPGSAILVAIIGIFPAGNVGHNAADVLVMLNLASRLSRTFLRCETCGS